MRELMKELKKLGFRKGYPVPFGFEGDLARIKQELEGEITAWDVVKGDREKFPPVADKYVVRYMGYHHGWHYFFVAKRRGVK